MASSGFIVELLCFHGIWRKMFRSLKMFRISMDPQFSWAIPKKRVRLYVRILKTKLRTTPTPLKSKSNPRRYYRKIEKLNPKVKDLLFKIGLAQHTKESQRKGCVSHLWQACFWSVLGCERWCPLWPRNCRPRCSRNWHYAKPSCFL